MISGSSSRRKGDSKADDARETILRGVKVLVGELVDLRHLATRVPALVPEPGPLGGELDGDGGEVHHLQHLLSLSVNLNNILFQSRHFRNVVVPPLPLLLLQLDGDSSNSAALEALHQVSDETSNLVSEGLGGDEGNLVHDPLVGVEVERQLGVVLLDDESRSLLNGLR